MITINKESSASEIHIQLDLGSVNYLGCYQRAIIDLIRHYNYEEEGQSAKDTMFFACELLEALLPSDVQVWEAVKQDKARTY
ncbi:MAG: hypothetical protein V4714_14015 [Bacteroidota bacterium]